MIVYSVFYVLRLKNDSVILVLMIVFFVDVVLKMMVVMVELRRNIDRVICFF